MGLFDMFNKKEHATIQVTFINNADNSIIGVAELSIDQLPDEFESATTMHLREENWQVEEAIPVYKKEFAQSGKLTLKMYKVEMVDPNELKFSLPTIANELPQLADSTLFDDFTFTLPFEDDWLQVELLDKDFMPYIEQNLAAIERIWNDYGHQEDGFTYFDQLHVRLALGEPQLSVKLEQLKQLLAVSKVGSLQFPKQQGYVVNGFALETDTAIYYGIVASGVVCELAISLKTEQVEEVVKLANKLGLVAVDWCRCQLLGK